MREGRNGGKLRNRGTGAEGRPKKLPALDLIMASFMAWNLTLSIVRLSLTGCANLIQH